MKKMHRAIEQLCKVVIGLIIFVMMAGFAGVRINHSFSYPVGLYWTTNKTPEKGDLVYACPPDNKVVMLAKRRGYLGFGDCSGEVERVIKRIVAMAGDSVVIGQEGVFVNGSILINSKPRGKDQGGRPVDAYSPDIFKVNEDEVLLMSEYNVNSFDGRYFGPVPLANIEHVIRPVITWER